MSINVRYDSYFACFIACSWLVIRTFALFSFVAITLRGEFYLRVWIRDRLVVSCSIMGSPVAQKLCGRGDTSLFSPVKSFSFCSVLHGYMCMQMQYDYELNWTDLSSPTWMRHTYLDVFNSRFLGKKGKKKKKKRKKKKEVSGAAAATFSEFPRRICVASCYYKSAGWARLLATSCDAWSSLRQVYILLTLSIPAHNTVATLTWRQVYKLLERLFRVGCIYVTDSHWWYLFHKWAKRSHATATRFRLWKFQTKAETRSFWTHLLA